MAQIGTVRLETQNSGVVDVPVFEPGDSASGIYEFVRVETASGPGFIPVTDPVDATYPYLRVQSQNNGIVAVTDTPGSDIPDSVVVDYEDNTVDPWTDNYLQITGDSYEGQNAAEIPQVDLSTATADQLDLTDVNGYDVSDPESISFYWKETSDQNGMAVSFFSSSGNELAFACDNPQWIGWDGSYNEFYSGASYNTWVYTEITFDDTEYTITSTAQEDDTTKTFTGSYRFGDPINTVSIGSFNNDPGDDATVDTFFDNWVINSAQ